MRATFFSSPLSLTLLLLAHGCGGDSGPSPDAATDAGMDSGPAVCETDLVHTLATSSGHADPLGVGVDEARAGLLLPSELPVDRTGLGLWEAGDFVLANEHIALVIEAVDDSDLFDPWGGKPVAIGRLEAGAIVEPADFNELSFTAGRYTVQTTSVGVLQDGSAGGSAIVRAVGFLRPIPFMDEFASSIISNDYPDIEVAIDYELAPGAEFVDVRVHYANERPGPARVRAIAMAFQKYRMAAFAPGVGFGDASGLPLSYMAFVDEEATSYALAPGEGTVEIFIEMAGVMALSFPDFNIDACAITERHFARIYVGGPGVDGLLESIARSGGVASREIRGSVVDGAGVGIGGAHVHAESADASAYLSRVMTAPDGSFVIHVPEAPVSLTAYATGYALGVSTALSAAETMATLMLESPGRIHVRAEELGGAPELPVRVQVIATSPLTRPPPSFGELVPPGSERLHVVFPANGDVTLDAPAGSYRVVVSRGYEYEIHDETVVVSSGATTEVLAQLERTVASPGVLCGDFHIHTNRSPDAEDSAEFKLRSALGDGIELPVRMDHEFVAAFDPLLTSLGLESWAYGVSAIELTTFEWGHMGVFPLEPDPLLPNDGSILWNDGTSLLPPAVFDDARSRPGDPTVIIFHPRASLGIFAYFDTVGYDPATGIVDRPEMWDDTWTVMETFNESSFDQNFGDSVTDWFSFLNRGRPVFSVGSSDSHNVMQGSAVGYPRTCVQTDTDDPTVARAQGSFDLRDRLLAGDMVISGGVYVTAEAVAGGQGPGELVSGAAAIEMVRVRVQAPSWIDVDELEVWVDGLLVETVPIPAFSGSALRLDAELSVPVATGGVGSWAIFHARGDAPLEPVHPGRQPFGVTNPIFFAR